MMLKLNMLFLLSLVRRSRIGRRNFPKLPFLFKDVKELGIGHAENMITGSTGMRVAVREVDVLIAGFVCKSVSSENNKRNTFAKCIDKGIGSTGETFSGVYAYIERFKPPIVNCENVTGLVKQFTDKETKKKMPAQVYSVMKAFTSSG